MDIIFFFQCPISSLLLLSLSRTSRRRRRRTKETLFKSLLLLLPSSSSSDGGGGSSSVSSALSRGLVTAQFLHAKSSFRLLPQSVSRQRRLRSHRCLRRFRASPAFWTRRTKTRRPFSDDDDGGGGDFRRCQSRLKGIYVGSPLTWRDR